MDSEMIDGEDSRSDSLYSEGVGWGQEARKALICTQNPIKSHTFLSRGSFDATA
jgi:hypothetical protein